MTARDRTIVLAVAAVGILAGFWFVILGPKREEAGRLSDQIAQERRRLSDAQASAAAAERARARYADDYATVARLGKAVPVQDDVPSLVYQLDSVAKDHGIDFRSVKLEQAAAGAAAPATPAAQVAQTGAAEKGTAAPATQAGAASLPSGTAVGPAGFPVMPFSFTFDGSFFDMEHFLRALDRLTFVRKDTVRVAGRLVTINGLTLSAGRKGFPRVQAAIDASAFLVPADEGLTGGATPQGPATPGDGTAASPAPTGSAGASATATLIGGNR